MWAAYSATSTGWRGVSRAGLLLSRRVHSYSQAVSGGLFNKKYDAIVVGGGHNGLIAAAYLQKAGRQVLVLERRHVIGGAAVTEEIIPGFKFSRASYLISLLRPKIIEDLKLKEHGLKLHMRNPSSYTPIKQRIAGKDQITSLTLGMDMEENISQIAQFSAKDARNYPLYVQFVGKVAQAMESLIDSPPPILTEFSSKAGLRKQLEELFQPARALVSAGYHLKNDLPSAYELLTAPSSKILNQWFESEPLKSTLATDAVIGAMLSPHTPGSGYVLLHHVMGGVDGVAGAWAYPHGGMGAVSQAIAAAAEKHGATIVVDANVEAILTDKDRRGVNMVNGVYLDDGTVLPSETVLSNATAHVTFQKLLNQETLPEKFRAEISTIDYSSPVTKINVALSGVPRFLSAHEKAGVLGPHHQTTIHMNCESTDMINTAYQNAAHGALPSDRPVIEMCLPSSLDSSLAPDGCHVASLFVQYTPYHLKDGQEWDEEYRSQFAEKVFSNIEEYAPGFRSLVVGYECLPPPELERIFGLTGGNIFHGAMSLDQLYMCRPVSSQAGYRSPISGLYLCGSSAHPGGGVMGACGYHAAHTVLKDVKSKAAENKSEK